MSMWHDEGAWIAMGVSVLFIAAGVIMHFVFIRILKTGATEHEQENHHE
ncbi:hypothetical protein [Limnohabitans sp. T6-5]|nr:hypothetical protein [Limnohabitans sp. T6-5]